MGQRWFHIEILHNLTFTLEEHSLAFLLARTWMWLETCFLVLVFPVLIFMYRAMSSFRPVNVNVNEMGDEGETQRKKKKQIRHETLDWRENDSDSRLSNDLNMKMMGRSQTQHTQHLILCPTLHCVISKRRFCAFEALFLQLNKHEAFMSCVYVSHF
jgi:hypothetical protein